MRSSVRPGLRETGTPAFHGEMVLVRLTHRPNGNDALACHEWSSECGVNGNGRSDATDQWDSPPRLVQLTTSRRGPSSPRTCRHTPHGGAGSAALVAMTRATKSRAPSATAVATATRSAHIDAGYDAFSTLHPA